jgi:uncharacterized membrane protein YeaQ/YmgE (transglycosylase-associated protein family)
MEIILWIIFGAIAGWVASIVVGTNDEQGAGLNIVVGIAGAILGGFIMRALGSTGVTGFNLGSLIVAIVGSVLLLLVVRMFRRSV